MIFISILGIGFLILAHEFGHFIAAKSFGMKAEKFYLGFPPAAIKKQIGETEYGIGFIPLGGYVKIIGMTREEEVPEELVPRAYYSQPIWQRVITISAGPLMNVFIAVLFFFAFYSYGVPIFSPTNVINGIQADSGAQAAGLQPGDRIISVNGVGNGDPESIRAELQSHPDQQATITYERDGATQTVVANLGKNDSGQGVLGFVFDSQQTGNDRLSPPEAFVDSIKDVGSITKEVFIVIKNLFVSSQARQDLSSPIGIVAVTSETISFGWNVYIRVLGFISLQLAIFNLLPLLPLDGGHVLFNLIEKVKGSPIRREVFERVSMVGLLLFGLLFIFGIMNDVSRLMSPGGFGIQP